MAMQPMALYGLEVPCGDVMIPAKPDIPSAFRITMAAIDPSAEPEGEEGLPPRATLKVIRQALDMDDDEDDESDDGFDQEEMERILREEASDESDSEDDAGVNGEPSDPEKKKMQKAAANAKKIKEMLEAEGMDVDSDEEEDEKPNGVNGVVKSSKAKGKQPASDSDEEEDSDIDSEDIEIEEFVVCTLDPNKLYQQPLDITIGEDEQVYFKVSGTHTIYLTGNYVEPSNGSGMYDPDSDEDEEYDLEPDMDELDDEDMDEVDDLDDMEDPRITDVDDEDEKVAPKLIDAAKNAAVNGKNKRPAPDSADEDETALGAPEGLDEMIARDIKNVQDGVNGKKKLTKAEKKAAKKLKANDGTAAAAPVVAKDEVEMKVDAPSSAKSDKKVSFAKDLEQGPTPTKVTEKAADKAGEKAKSGPTLGVKTVQGVTIDDKKLGQGQAAKNGDRVSMRYIGKLQNGKVFDSNKKGSPFKFKLGAGEVIKGWEIGVQGMQVGAERRITIPAHLGYGSQKMADIPPNSTLIFDIKVLDITKK